MSFPLAIAFNGNLPTDADAVIVITGNVEDLGQAESYRNGRIALFAKGRIKGDYLLTMAYDSTKQRMERRYKGEALLKAVGVAKGQT